MSKDDKLRQSIEKDVSLMTTAERSKILLSSFENLRTLDQQMLGQMEMLSFLLRGAMINSDDSKQKVANFLAGLASLSSVRQYTFANMVESNITKEKGEAFRVMRDEGLHREIIADLQRQAYIDFCKINACLKTPGLFTPHDTAQTTMTNVIANPLVFPQ